MNAQQKEVLHRLLSTTDNMLEHYRTMQCVMSAHNFREEARIFGLKYDVCKEMCEIVSDAVNDILRMEDREDGKEE